MSACVICATRGRTRELEDGHTCHACRTALHTDLGRIVELVALAGELPDPFASRPAVHAHPGSRPPIDLAHIDPALILVRLEPDDPSSDEPLLAVLESWERAIREDRGFAPYGIASSLRGDPTPDATIVSVVGFLQSQVEWACDEPTFAVEELARHVRRAIAALSMLDPNHEPGDGWRIPCPTDVENDDGDIEACGRRLTIARRDDGSLDLHTDLRCPSCRTLWTAQRLLLVALADERVTVWGYPEAIAGALDITSRTLRRWAEAGHIRRHGGQYDAGAAFRRRHAVRDDEGA